MFRKYVASAESPKAGNLTYFRKFYDFFYLLDFSHFGALNKLNTEALSLISKPRSWLLNHYNARTVMACQEIEQEGAGLALSFNSGSQRAPEKDNK